MNIIKNITINKIIISTMCLVLLGIFYFIPTPEEFESEIITTQDLDENIVYLLDEDNYVSQVITYFNSETLEIEIKNKINILINGSEENKDFYSLIPKNTKLNSVKIDKDNVYLDFSKELLEVNKYIEESMIEAIVYTLTEINGVNNIYINVEGKELTHLPNSNKNINYPLNRNIGINKEYNITNLNDIVKTTVFFSKESNDTLYYVPVTKINNINEDKIEIIIEELKSTINSQNNLNGYINDNLELESYKTKDNIMNLVFNEYLLENDDISEEVKYVISESIFENYDVSKVVFNVKNTDKVVSISKN